MSQVTISFGGSSKSVDRAVAESQVAKAEQAIAQLQAKMAARARDAAADRATLADIARYEAIAAACRAALEA